MNDAKRDAMKDALEGAAAVGGAVTIAGGGPREALAAGVVALVSQLFNGVRGWRDRRVAKWLTLVLAGDDSPEQFAARLRDGLDNERGEVIEAVLRGARTAEEAIDDDALACIATLTRLHATGQAPLWFFRAALDLFKNLNGDEIRDLQWLLEIVTAADEPTTALRAEPFQRGGAAEIQRRIVDDKAQPWHAVSRAGMAPLTSAVQLLSVLQIDFGDALTSYGGRSARNTITIQRADATRLVEVIAASVKQRPAASR